ncbi:hypothetical protein FGU65_14080 [Methanoculleus sp. FWC-SCC1]|uniref:Uncharacterized protein n=1 Tax=Methanoculleus frigidifontis TaxID=2584085 RepID=A0ABT8MDH8_9EURY|nr:hypothetical protein [Methanoculleus sp. FWC-SCC1]MDN7025999.1 hypothetical protein [Methanoculleus sp. FWC-SCC1]
MAIGTNLERKRLILSLTISKETYHYLKNNVNNVSGFVDAIIRQVIPGIEPSSAAVFKNGSAAMGI